MRVVERFLSVALVEIGFIHRGDKLSFAESDAQQRMLCDQACGIWPHRGARNLLRRLFCS